MITSFKNILSEEMWKELFILKIKQNKKYTSLWKLRCVRVCPTVYPLSTHLYLQMFIAMSYWSVSRPWASLLHYLYWILTGTPLGYFAVALCHGGPAALILQDQPLHMLQRAIDAVDDGVEQLRAPDLGLGGSWGIPPASFPVSTATGASSPALPTQGVGPALPQRPGKRPV